MINFCKPIVIRARCPMTGITGSEGPELAECDYYTQTIMIINIIYKIKKPDQ
jgi:hypothetical protein